MQQIISTRILGSALLICLCLAWSAAAADTMPEPPDIDARAHILIDFNSGQVLAAENEHEPVEPASLTKLMTAYVVFHEIAEGRIDMDDEVTISEKAWRAEGSRMFVEVGSQVSVEDLLKGMIIQSGNDASIALAEHVAGSESAFANLMNRHAERIGARNTNFVNSNGLPHPELRTTAYDIAQIGSALIRDFPEFYEWYSRRDFTYNNITQYNRNRLLHRDASVDGMKTGYTASAGYSLATSAERDGMRLISVVIGTDGHEDRLEESQTLLNFGFRFFETHELYAAGDPVTELRVWGGEPQSVPVGPREPLYVTVPRGRYEDLVATTELQNNLEAPLDAGTDLGRIEVSLEEEPIAERPLIAVNTVEQGSLWRRAVDTVLRWFD